MDDRIVAALDDPEQPAMQKRLRVAVHEIGHALAFTAAGFKVRVIEVYTAHRGHLFGGCWLDHGLGELDDESFEAQSEGYMVAAMAGHAAEAQFARVYLGLDASAAYEVSRPAAAHDYDTFHFYRRQWGLAITAAQAYQRAETFLRRHSTRLDDLTLRLAHAGRMTAL